MAAQHPQTPALAPAQAPAPCFQKRVGGTMLNDNGKRIPARFARENVFGQEEIMISNENERTWNVSVTVEAEPHYYRFTEGWIAFTRGYGVMNGDILQFTRTDYGYTVERVQHL
ncbi:hypothetical protein ACJIZ3_005738 [Penstemon smallii]|uniref:TF-B3 domain-containing protein n=1 Tax=Penstemon smallii TaxID=265156 RepID=A0ABD3S5R5_9LAMI